MDTLPIIIDQYPYAGRFLMLMLRGIGMPGPEDATLILSGFLMAQGIVRPLPLRTAYRRPSHPAVPGRRRAAHALPYVPAR